jgi:hypothetical protein
MNAQGPANLNHPMMPIGPPTPQGQHQDVALFTKKPQSMSSVPAPNVVPGAVGDGAIDPKAHMTTGHLHMKTAHMNTWKPNPNYHFSAADTADAEAAQCEDAYSQLWRCLTLIVNTAVRNQEPAGTSGGSGTT